MFAAGTAATAVYAPGALAQEQEVEQIIVTGSRIPQPNLESTSPISSISAADVAIRGTQNVENLMNQMPQVFAGQSANYSNGATGTATVDLRGLGASRTLVLINGRRMAAGDPRNEAPDLNQIPASLIERVEVLTGGASAVYGSSAVAGVVNFIMKSNFEGVQFDGTYAANWHNNSDNSMQNLVKSRGFKAAPGTVWDGNSWETSLTMGSNFADNRGNATLFFDYKDTSALLQSERDFSACTVTATKTGFACGGSSTSYPGRFYDLNTGKSWTLNSSTGAVRPFVGATDQYNYGPLNYWQRPDQRWNVSAFMHYDLTDAAQLYGEFMFMDDHTKSQIAPSGSFFGGVTFNVPCDGSNPLITSQWRSTLCGTSTTGGTEMWIGRRNVEGGGRQDDLRHTSYRGVIGVKGTMLDDNWNYDVSALYNRVLMTQTYLHDFSNTRLTRAMDVVKDPKTGQAVCASVLDGTDPNCVPYNIWSLGGVTRDALGYVSIPLFANGYTELTTVSASATSDLGKYGIKMPTARDAVGVAVGVDYIQNALNFQTDPNFASGDGAGQGGPTIGQKGGYNSTEFFGEVRAPLVQDMFMADSLLLNASYRYSDYSNPINESTSTYGIGLEWGPIKSLKFRGSFQHAVRAPSIVELFAAQSVGLYDNDYDPCAGPTPVASLAACANTGVTAAQYGRILDNPAGQYNGFFGGNPDLKPEKADTYTVGLVYQPEWLERSSITVDYFDIKVDDVVGTISPTITLNTCLDTGNPQFCGLITRDSQGTLWANPSARIVATNQNIGSLATSGIDVNLLYGTDISSYGSLNFSLIGTYLMDLTTEPIAGAGSIGKYDCVGYYGSSCGTPNPEWRSTFRATWNTPWNWELSLAWRYFGSVNIDKTSNDPLLSGTYQPIDKTLDSQNYFDLAGAWTIAEKYTLRVGMNNITDSDPPLSSQVGAGAGNGNTYPSVYDALGRYTFVSLTAKF
ncbi:MAG: TonB-dependent receptor [Gammaproteobacteria bacterium]|nr:TonB-dependent receptor [Gammaproteobacteria bacterium]